MTPAGFIICDSMAIWAAGSTEAAAWDAWRAVMASAGITVIPDDVDVDRIHGGWTRARNFQCRPATADLIALVADGGAIAWVERDGIHCTLAEYDPAA